MPTCLVFLLQVNSNVMRFRSFPKGDVVMVPFLGTTEAFVQYHNTRTHTWYVHGGLCQFTISICEHTQIISAAMGASCSLMFPFSSSDSPPQDNDSSMMEEGRTGDSPASSVGNKTTSTMSTMKRSASPVVGSPTSMEDEDPEAGDQVKILLLGAGESGKCETADAD